ncbi:MAG: hypothetical protein WB699_17855 [Bacteroidota bacterium]
MNIRVPGKCRRNAPGLAFSLPARNRPDATYYRDTTGCASPNAKAQVGGAKIYQAME